MQNKFMVITKGGININGLIKKVFTQAISYVQNFKFCEQFCLWI
jgi:hypothetical protein